MTTATHPFDTSEDRARDADVSDPAWRDRFHIPQINGQDAAYFCGNSLGLQPKAARALVETELDDWASLGVDGHHDAEHPWFPAHERFREPLSRLVGALPGEVVAMNSLTANLHFLMASFYSPTRDRFKIVIEDDAFPSDSYAVASQARFHGFDPVDAILRLRPREGERTLRTEDILDALDREGERIALVMLGGVNYLTGQWFHMEQITARAHSLGALVGWDLAHAAGNVPVRLHDWGPDFAAWCSYKYLNSGPGGVGGAFVHERHSDSDLPRFEGWWGNDPKSRFRMEKDFVPVAGADAWQLSNPPIMALAPMGASLDLFDEAGIDTLRDRSLRLTGYLESLLRERLGDRIEIWTPSDPAQRGAQLSISVRGASRGVRDALHAKGVVADFREPDVIRVAPAPLYNSYHDCWTLVDRLRTCLEDA